MSDEELNPNMDIRLLNETASTNELALQAVDDGAAEGTVFVADTQSAGRGRREADGGRRQWHSPPGQNLYLSVVVRPRLALEKSSALTVAVGIALVEYLRDRSGIDVRLKWPNDLMVGDRKLAGILSEGVTGARGLEAVVVGMGLNVNAGGEDFPHPLREIATSLYEECGRPFDRLTLALDISEVIVNASHQYADAGLEAFAERIEKWDYLRGRRVQVRDDGVDASAEACGIGPGGGLMVQFDDGRSREIISGEVLI